MKEKSLQNKIWYRCTLDLNFVSGSNFKIKKHRFSQAYHRYHNTGILGSQIILLDRHLLAGKKIEINTHWKLINE